MAKMPMSAAQRDRLRKEHQRERELTERVLAAHRQLTAEQRKRDAAIAAADARVANSAERFADALVAYVDSAGVLPGRAAAVLGMPTSAVVQTVRRRRTATRSRQGLSNQRLEADAERGADERGRTDQ